MTVGDDEHYPQVRADAAAAVGPRLIRSGRGSPRGAGKADERTADALGILPCHGVGTATPALAADYDVLRGSEPVAPVVTVGPATFTRWSGFYVGGVASYNNATTDFINATQPLVAFSLRATTLEEQVHPSGIAVLGKGAGSAFGGGAFLGYNTQWQDPILGVEATYTHTNLSTTATGSAVARISDRDRGSRPQRQRTFESY